jgi:hypothetical protein
LLWKPTTPDFFRLGNAFERDWKEKVFMQLGCKVWTGLSQHRADEVVHAHFTPDCNVVKGPFGK